MKYIYKHGNQFWYQRAVPGSLNKIIGKKSIKIALKTNKISTAIKRSKIQALEHIKMFKFFESNSKNYLKKIFSKKTINIKKYEIKFLDDYDDLVSKLVFSKSNYLNNLKTNLSIDDKNKGTIENFLFKNVQYQFPLFSETPKILENNTFYITNKELIDKSINDFLKICDDKLINEYNIEDAQKIYNFFSKTNNVQYGKIIYKSLNEVFRILFKYYNINQKLFLKNIKWSEKNENKIRQFTENELELIKSDCLKKKDMISFIIGLMFDTGCSFNELMGLSGDDVNLDKITPFLIIRSNPKRTIKNINKIRTIPLIGMALWGAQNIFSNNKSFLSMHLKNSSSKTYLNEPSINKRIQKLSDKKTITSFRHSLVKRLIGVECPEEVILDIIGNSKRNRLYNREISLELKSSWLKQIDLPTNN
ncbi:MAG: hypothetical protein CMM95_02835 [Rickettsiales bacterium]|nr:hypothetical protein [Rickettsiales bacterium]